MARLPWLAICLPKKSWQFDARGTVYALSAWIPLPTWSWGEAGVDALTYYFENFIEDVESGVVKPAAVILEAIQGEGGVVPAPKNGYKNPWSDR